MNTPFVHLHCHSDYSMLDGMATIDGYVERCGKLGMTAMALTDHGNMHGVVEFHDACRKAGIKPILGCEFYSTHERTSRNPDDKYSHLILLAMDGEGYRQLLRLQTIAWTEGKWYKPRIDDRALEADSSHLICLSACISGDIPKLILKGDVKGAMDRARWYRNLFGDRFYIEVQNHGLPDERRVAPVLIQIAQELGIKVVATNDVHYLERSDWDAHDTMLCIGTKERKRDVDRLRYKEGEYYMRSGDEMAALFPGHPEFLANTLEVADRCNVELKLPGPILPKCSIPEGYASDAEYLKAMAYEGLDRRYPDADPDFRKKLEERLDHELGIIERMDFPAYFLIVADYINWAKDHGIAVGPGRGSGAGSLVAYCCRITDVDPIRYGLLFERFLNPDRVTMPDFDIDFCQERRGEVIEYVSEHYGKDHVGQIATFTVEKAKAVLKDVARVFGVSPEDANKLSALVPDSIPGKKDVTLKDAVEYEPKLKALAQGMEYGTLMRHALVLEGLHRHSSLHPAGVVIGRDRLDTYVPLMTDASGAVASQISSPTIEDCGLVKMDFLGLKTLTLIRNASDLIRRHEPDFDIEKVPDDDKATFDMLGKGEASAVFQFESPGMKDILKRTKPASIEELAALNALYRPGPIQFIDQYIDSKWGRTPITYPDDCLKDILEPTYGVIVYQEQVMQVAQRIAGYSLGEADNLRRIMGKKKVDKMAKELEKFVAGAVKNGFEAKHAEDIFHILEPFAGYGFNKSHAVAYSVIAYRTAYLKAHYPAEFMAANLTNESDNPDKFREYLSLAPRWGLKVLPPSINESMTVFSVHDGNIVYGLSAVKNVGRGISGMIVAEREKNGPYRNVYDFVSRIEVQVGSRTYESLVKAGCFDCFGIDRAVLLADMKDLLEYDRKRRARDEKGAGQLMLLDIPEPEREIPESALSTAPASWAERLAMEKEYLGFYVSGHPVDEYSDVIDRCVSTDISDPSTIRMRRNVSIVAEVSDYVKKRGKKSGKEYGLLSLSLREGVMDVYVMGEILEQKDAMLSAAKGTVIGLIGTFSKDDEGGLKFRPKDICPPEALPEKNPGILHVRFSSKATPRDIAFARLWISRESDKCTDKELSVMFSSEDDPTAEELLPFKTRNNAELIGMVRRIKGVEKAWTE